jgi:hypothetical protein
MFMYGRDTSNSIHCTSCLSLHPYLLFPATHPFLPPHPIPLPPAALTAPGGDLRWGRIPGDLWRRLRPKSRFFRRRFFRRRGAKNAPRWTQTRDEVDAAQTPRTKDSPTSAPPSDDANAIGKGHGQASMAGPPNLRNNKFLPGVFVIAVRQTMLRKKITH